MLEFLCIAQWAFIAWLLWQLLPVWKIQRKVEALRVSFRKRKHKRRGRPSKVDEVKLEIAVAQRLQDEAEQREDKLPDGVVPY